MSLENLIIDYREHESDILHWVNLKGEYRYLKITSFLKDNNISMTWENVTYYIKYDKRLIINMFKYITFLDELFKSFINQKTENSQRKILTMDFPETLDAYLLLGDDVAYDGVNIDELRNNKQAFIEFRNAIAHNKVLLGRQFDNRSLEEIIKLFVCVLPMSYREGFKKEINGCCRSLVENKWHIAL